MKHKEQVGSESVRIPYTGPQESAPQYASSHAAGADLRASIETPVKVKPGQRVLIPTGISLAIPPGWEGQIRPRSGLAWKKGITLLNSPGTIDADYRGEIRVILINHGEDTVEIEPGQRIAQIVITQAPQAVFQFTGSLPDSDRGAGGFGSTGI